MKHWTLHIRYNYLEYIIHSYIYLYLILDTHILVQSTSADPGIFVRGIIGKSLENYDKQKINNDKIKKRGKTASVWSKYSLVIETVIFFIQNMGILHTKLILT